MLRSPPWPRVPPKGANRASNSGAGPTFSDGQPQAGAAELAGALARHLREGAEEVFLLVLGDADAGVGHFEGERYPRLVGIVAERRFRVVI